MNKIYALFILCVCLPSFAATPIPIKLERVFDASKWVLRAKVISKTSIQMCNDKSCDDGYLYRLHVSTEIKGRADGELFCSTYSFDTDVEYLFFLRPFDGHVQSRDSRSGVACRMVSTFNDQNVFRFSKIGNKPVIDIPNPPSVLFPQGVSYYNSKDDNENNADCYFSADWMELNKYLTSYFPK